MKPYKHHFFVCTGKRCTARGSEQIRDAFKSKIKALASDEVKISQSGCLKVCKETAEEGKFCPAVVVYPAGVWYKNVSVNDVDEIIKSHVENDAPVERLMLFNLKAK